MAEQRPPDHPEPRRQSPQRRPYTSPRLIEYGSVTKLTRGTKSVSSDFPQSGFKRRS